MSGSFGFAAADGAGAIARRIRERETTVIDVIEDHLARLASARESIGGVAWTDDAAVLEAAHAADRALAEGSSTIGPLHGVPITVKDWIDVAGFPCAGESVRHRDRRPPEDATVVARLRAAGAIVIAKTAAGDRNEIYGVTRNPHDQTRSPGASSRGKPPWSRPEYRRSVSAATVAGASACRRRGAESPASSRPPGASPIPDTSLASARYMTAEPRSGPSRATWTISRWHSR